MSTTVTDLGGSVSIFAADGVANVLHGALNGISFRQNVIADNIANVDTPDFRARAVDFESSLKGAIASGDVTSTNVSFTASPTQTPVGANGNNVDLRKETMAAMQSTFQYQIVSRSVSDRLDLVRTAAGGM
jgi:flagellar basal-body rod protein FlgB